MKKSIDYNTVGKRMLLILSVLVSSFSSYLFALSLLLFVFNMDDKKYLYIFLGLLLLTAVFWGLTFLVAGMDKNKTKAEKQKEFKNLVAKMPLILASTVITSFYVLIYFFFFSFLTVGKEGGYGSTAGQILIWVFIAIALVIFSIVMYRVFKTDKQDITLTLYSQFNVLKWSSLIALILGVWATYYYFHDGNFVSWGSMFLWDLLLFGIYKFFDKLANKAQKTITDTSYNRIVHEQKKNILNDELTPKNTSTPQVASVADEIIKLKKLMDDGVITAEEFDVQKKKLL